MQYNMYLSIVVHKKNILESAVALSITIGAKCPKKVLLVSENNLRELDNIQKLS